MRGVQSEQRRCSANNRFSSSAVLFAASAMVIPLTIRYYTMVQGKNIVSLRPAERHHRYPFAGIVPPDTNERDINVLPELYPLPPPVSMPSPSNPFIFFHFRKCGGSAFRPSIARAADRHGLSFLVPCQEKVGGDKSGGNLMQSLVGQTDHPRSCHTYYLGSVPGMVHSNNPAFRNATDLSVFAGHFYYDSASFLGVLSPPEPPGTLGRYATGGLERPPFSCVIMVRDPVDRFLSCYEERFKKGLGGRPVSNLTLDELGDALANRTQATMPHGCSNEIARWLSPVPNDARVNQGWLSVDDVGETKRRIAGCVVGNVAERRDDTLRVVGQWHPWLAEDYKGDKNDGHQSKSSVGSRARELSTEATALIRRHNALDAELYDFAMRRFEMQLAEVDEESRAQ